jgi:cyclic pyranopterin phosphate synthase
MPAEGIPCLPNHQILSFEELERLVKIFVGLGIAKVRFTGGEPFARRGFFDFLQSIDAQDMPALLCITTNGVLMGECIERLRDLKRLFSINLSFHTFRKERFALITRRDEFAQAQQTLYSLLGLDIPFKINCVVQKEINADEILDFAQLTKDYPIEVRFIEKMQFNGGQALGNVVTAKEIITKIQTRYPALTKLAPRDSTSEKYKIEGFKGTVGVIAGYSRLFCHTCNRVRITPTGDMKWCLYDKAALNLRDLMRSGDSDMEIQTRIRLALSSKKANGWEAEKDFNDKPKESMAFIGG